MAELLFSEEVAVLFGGEGVDLAAPVGEFAAGDFAVDFEWDVVDHVAGGSVDC